MFDSTHPSYPPDIIFSEGDEQLEFEPNIDQLEVHIGSSACTVLYFNLAEVYIIYLLGHHSGIFAIIHEI